MYKLLIILLFIPLLGISQKDTSYWKCNDIEWVIINGDFRVVMNDSVDLNMGEVTSTTYFRRALRFELNSTFYVKFEIFFRRFKYKGLDFVIIETIDSVNFYEVLK